MKERDTAEGTGAGPAEAHGGARAEVGGRGIGSLLLDRTVGSYFTAKVLASVGIWIHNVVAAIVVFELTGSAFLVGAVSIAQFTPQLLLAPWMGALADRGDRRRQVIIGRMLISAGSGGLALWIVVAGLDGLGAAAVIAAAFVVGCGYSISGPAMHALIPTLAAPSDLSAVIAITSSPLTIARAVGPAVGALLLIAFGPAAAFGVAAVGQVIYSVVVSRLRLRPVERIASTDGSVRAGLSYVRRDTRVALLLFAIMGVGFGVDPVITLAPSIAESYGAGESLVAAMASAFGAGAAIMVLFVGTLGRRMGQPQLGTAGLCVLAGSMLGVAASPTPEVTVVSFFVGGLGMMAAITTLSTELQERIPEDLRGRVMALWSVCFVGSRPLAAALNGAIADYRSADAALVVLTGILVVIVIVTRPRPAESPA